MDLTEEPQLKEFASRGGQVVFRLPANWKMEPNNNGAIYFAESDPGALFLDVLTFSGPNLNPEGHFTAGGFVRHQSPYGMEYGRREMLSVEDGEEIQTTGWLLSFLARGHLILPIFSFTVETNFLGTEETKKLSQVIEREVLACRLALDDEVRPTPPTTGIASILQRIKAKTKRT